MVDPEINDAETRLLRHVAEVLWLSSGDRTKKTRPEDHIGDAQRIIEDFRASGGSTSGLSISRDYEKLEADVDRLVLRLGSERRKAAELENRLSMMSDDTGRNETDSRVIREIVRDSSETVSMLIEERILVSALYIIIFTLAAGAILGDREFIVVSIIVGCAASLFRLTRTRWR